MKLKSLIPILYLVIAVVLSGCDKPRYRKHVPTKETVKSYRVHADTDNDGDNDDWLYWYIIYDNNTRNYYTSSSPTPVSSYSSLSWSRSTTKPEILEELADEFAEDLIETLTEVEVEVSDLGNDLTMDLTTDYADIPTDSLDSMEGVPDSSDSMDSDSSSDSSDSSSDSGSDSGGD